MFTNDRWPDDSPDDDPDAQALRDFLDDLEPPDLLPTYLGSVLTREPVAA